MYSKIFAKGKTISLLYKCILVFFSFQTDLCPHNRHSHRADAIHCVSIETAKPFKRRRHSNSEARNFQTAPATETTKKSPPKRGFFAYEKSLLLSDIQFVDEVLCSVEFIDYPKYITSINIDCSLHFGAEDEVRAEPFPVAVESKTDEFAVAVDDW